MQESKFR